MSLSSISLLGASCFVIAKKSLDSAISNNRETTVSTDCRSQDYQLSKDCPDSAVASCQAAGGADF